MNSYDFTPQFIVIEKTLKEIFIEKYKEQVKLQNKVLN